MKKIDLSNTALIVAIICVSIATLMVFGSSIGLWEPIVGFGASRNYNNLLGYIAIVAATISLIFSLYNQQLKSGLKSVFALVLGLAIIAPSILSILKEPVRYPPIHDITTDTQDPPQFSYLTDTRSGAKNSLVYAGKEIAEQQLKAFPDITPIISKLSSEQAYLKALDIAKNMGWKIVYEDQIMLVFEATARTPFFNFADDIVVKVSNKANVSIVNVRSVSRIGRGDRGVNAQRIRQFTKSFEN
tara:strand:+ start:452 stop:1183 length:732 start_codon:yes stop_codon:yes gene_type:complete